MGVQLACSSAPTSARGCSRASRGRTASASPRTLPGHAASMIPMGGKIASTSFGGRAMGTRGRLGCKTRARMQDTGDADDGMPQSSISDDDISGLMRRVSDYRDNNAEIPVMTLDCILPGQKMEVLFPWGGEWIGILNVIRSTTNTFGMVGINITTRKPCEWGTEVEVVSVDQSDDGLLVEIVGRRRFTVEGEGSDIAGVAMTPVRWSEQKDAGDEVHHEEFNLAVAKAASLRCLVHEWERLVHEGGHERLPGHLQEVKQALGPMPSLDEPDACAMWAAALINPPVKLGVAYEIRPKVLGARTACEMLDIVARNYTLSIKHLNGTRPLF